MKVNKEKIIEILKRLSGDNIADDVVEAIEFLNDNMNEEISRLTDENAKLKKDLEDTNRYWRDKYVSRFLEKDIDKDIDVEDEEEEVKEIKIEDVLKEED